ncbi:MAG: hypothetical protein O3A92_08730 [Verrucomicrobia bacterium]|nr:hypothetical protein [Verrucomicrobiota bacterium]
MARIAGPAGRLKPTPLRPTEFLDSLPPNIPHLHFSFDSMAGNEFVVEGDHADAPAISAWLERGQVPADKSPQVAGKFGKALPLNGTGDHIRTDWPGLPGRKVVEEQRDDTTGQPAHVLPTLARVAAAAKG